jgi:dihydroxyacetone kinase
MSVKHFFPTQDGLVVQALKGLASMNPSLAVSERDKIIFYAKHDRTKVSVLSGGGSGHEPGHSGFVGQGMLAAAVCGDVFASPSTKQVITGCELVESDAGYIFIVTNYTGDMLHFGLACEKLKAAGVAGRRIAIIKSADDVSVGRRNGSLVGRRGLSGTIILNKLIGAGAEQRMSFEQLVEFGTTAANAIVTISVGLDHCHVPGHNPKDFSPLGVNECEIGLGIHNEPGVQRLDRVPPIDQLVKTLLGHLIDITEDRGYLQFDKSDKVVVMINNLGGISIIEQNAIVNVVLSKLQSEYGIEAVRVYAGHFMTSLNAPIFSITLFNVTKSITNTLSEHDVLSLLDAPTDAVGWPRNHYHNYDPIALESRLVATGPAIERPVHDKDIKIEPLVLDNKLRNAANNVISVEPLLTMWDTKMGDGDCGKTLEAGCRALIEALDDGLAMDGSVLYVLDSIIEITEDKMGGTLGAIFGIYCAAFSSSLKELLQTDESRDSEILVTAANEALIRLSKHTLAVEGDRTVMDVLIPFCRALVKTKSLETAAEVAHEAAEKTKQLKPKLGRATYVGGLDDMTVFPPDPGAWALYEIVRGIASSNQH